jgi:DNA primase
MPMIPQEEIERLKRETDLAAVVRSRGIELKPQGTDLVGLCPFHDDHRPSLHVTPAKGLWRCPSCQATGNVIQFVQRYDGVSFRHAFELLKAGKGAALSGPPVKVSTVPKLECPLAPNADDQAALRQVTSYYHERLRENPDALAYLKKRGIGSDEAIAAFKLGFVDRTLGLRLPKGNRVEGAQMRERLTRLGILRESGHEHLRGRVVFPVIAENGDIGTVYGRAIDDGGKHERHLFLPGPQRGLWNPAGLKSEEVIVTEGIIDALTWWCAGYRNVTAAYSAKGLPPELLEAIVAAKVKRVCLSFDRDKAGEEGTAAVTEQLAEHGIELRRILFPPGLDANAYALKVTPPAKSLGLLLQSSRGEGRRPVASHAPARAFSSLAAQAAVAAPVAAVPEARPEPTAPARSEEATRGRNDVARPTPTAVIAAPVAAAPVGAALELKGTHHVLAIEAREYRLSGLLKAEGVEALKVTLRLKVGEVFHQDALDLCRDLERRRFAERAAEETGLPPEVIRRDLGRLLFAAEQAVEASAETKAKAAAETAAVPALSPQERQEALEWLTAPGLIDRLRAAFRSAGIIGEETNALIAYLSCVSRQLDRPLAVIVQSASAAGKTTLMEHVLAFFPEECRVKYSALTGQSLYYLGETSLKHKILAVVEEAGAEKASYALKLLQSEGELTIASTGKDPHTGRMVTQEYHVEGPCMIFLTTTAIDLDEELQNRCLTLAVDESAAQTARIHEMQRERRTLAGLVAREERKDLLRVMRNAQRLLRPIAVANDYAPKLTFPSERTRARRDHEKYLTLIDAIALLHQHQRRVRPLPVAGRLVDYIEATLEDIALANELARVVLARSLDELPPQTRGLLGQVQDLVRAKKGGTFTRRELREKCGWSLTQVRAHLDRLVELEYLAVRSGRFGSLFVYELLVTDEQPFAVPLIDVQKLRLRPNLAGPKGHLAGGGEMPPPGVKVA